MTLVGQKFLDSRIFWVIRINQMVENFGNFFVCFYVSLPLVLKVWLACLRVVAPLFGGSPLLLLMDVLFHSPSKRVHVEERVHEKFNLMGSIFFLNYKMNPFLIRVQRLVSK